jgi:hypothetical protein
MAMIARGSQVAGIDLDPGKLVQRPAGSLRRGGFGSLLCLRYVVHDPAHFPSIPVLRFGSPGSRPNHSENSARANSSPAIVPRTASFFAISIPRLGAR